LALALDEAEGGVVLVLDDVPDVPVPDVPAAPLPAGWVLSTNFVSDALALPDVPVEPGVPVGLALERSMHPVTVTLLAELELELGVCVGGGVVCAAATAIASVQTIAAHIPDHTLFFIVSSCITLSLSALPLSARRTP
jgi:hypothetical protein